MPSKRAPPTITSLPALDSTHAVEQLVSTMLGGDATALSDVQRTALRTVFDIEFSSANEHAKQTSFMHVHAPRSHEFTAALCVALLLVRWQERQRTGSPTSNAAAPYTLVAFSVGKRAASRLVEYVALFMQRLYAAWPSRDSPFLAVARNVESVRTRHVSFASYSTTPRTLRGVAGDSLVVNGAFSARFMYEVVTPCMELANVKTLFVCDDDVPERDATIYNELVDELVPAGHATRVQHSSGIAHV